MKKLNLFSFYFSCTFTFFHCYFFSNFYLHRGARQSCLLLTPLLLDEGLPEWWPSWSQFSINFLLFGKIFIVLPTFSYSTEIVFNLNFTLSNQMSIFLWWQCPIAPQKNCLPYLPNDYQITYLGYHVLALISVERELWYQALHEPANQCKWHNLSFQTQDWKKNCKLLLIS